MPEKETEDLESDKFHRPEYIRRASYLALAFVALVIISLFPAPSGLSVEGQRALGVLAFVTILWVTETFPLGLTALFGGMLLTLLGVLDTKQAFVGFMNPALFFLFGGISFGIAMQKTNLHKRVALKFLQRFGKSSSMTVLSVCLLGGFMSFTMPEHAVAALLLPVLMGMVEAGNISREQNFGIAIFLALTYSTSVGSIGTLLGGARNVLALGILNEYTGGASLGFIDWIIAGAPISIVLMFLTFIVLKIVYPWEEVDTDKIRREMKEEVEKIGPVSTAEKKAAIIFASAFVLWMAIGTRIGLATIAIGGMILLVISRTITWRDVEQNMPWGILFLYGGALTLSHALSKETEAVKFIADGITGFIGDNPFLVLVALLLIVILISNLISNSAATAVILPIALATLTQFYSNRLPTFLIAMGSAMAFLLPIGTPSAAMAYSSGYVEIEDLVKAGSVLCIVSIATFLTFGLGWWKLLGIW